MYDLTPTEKSNRSALLIVQSRYSQQLAPFVKNSKARFAYVETKIADIIEDVCDETGANEEWVRERFLAALNSVLEMGRNIKREELTNPDPNSPYAKNLAPDSQEGREGIKDADVADRGEVPGAGREEALTPDARQDLNEETAAPGAPTEVATPNVSTSCFRCGDTLEKEAKSVVCSKCNHELLKLAFPGTIDDAATGVGAGAPPPGIEAEPEPATNPNVPYVCKICGREGTPDEILGHINAEHADVLQRANQYSPENMGQDDNGVTAPQLASTKEGWKNVIPVEGMRAGDPCPNCGAPTRSTTGSPDDIICDNCRWMKLPGGETHPPIPQRDLRATKTADVPRAEDTAEVQPLPTNPGDKFDDYVQRLAETAAARKFSTVTDEDIHSIASQVGASPDDVKNSLVAVAVFGDNVAVNGQLGGDPTPPDGYEEVSAQGLTGQQPTHDALVPTDLIIQTVANDLNMSNDLAYQQVKDKYGDDLPDKYHASVSGQVHYYLPTDLAGNQQPQEQAPQQPVQQQPVQPQVPAQQPQQPLQPTQ